MHIKRFEAANMDEALEKVKQTLGPEALILSSRTIRQGRNAFGFMARERVEVQAALERGAASTTASQETRADAIESATAVGASIEAPVDSLLRELLRELAVLRSRERFEEEVRSELRGLRQALGGVLGGDRGGAAGSEVEKIARRGLDWIHAESLVSAWRESTGEGECRSLDEVLRQRIEDRIAPPRAEEEERVRIVVGAPGVGKTTTLAKIAARNEEGERDVALVSLDHYRIGAADQLRHYAEFLDAPFCEVAQPAELADAIGRLRGRSVLVDTAGRDRSGEDRLGSLLPLREQLGERASIELVIDATSRREVQRAQLSRFGPLGLDRLILTKTDECDSLADVTNLLLDAECPPVCWLGTGQRVPEDLAPAEADRLVRDVLGRAA